MTIQSPAVAKYLLTTDGQTVPLKMTPEQWDELRLGMKHGSTAITTTKQTLEVFAVLEIAKGYVGKGLSNEHGMLMLFDKEEA